MKQELIDFVKKQYPNEAKVAAQIDETIPNYLDDDWENEHESEFDAYLETGRGEAEGQIVNQISNDFLKEKNITEDEYLNQTGQNTWDTIYEVYDILDA